MIKNRQSIRLKNYDYSKSGLYFVTVCTQNRECLFGDVIDEKMILNEFGKIIDNVFKLLLNRHEQIKLDVYQIMPNHINMVIQIVGAGFMPARDERATTRVAPTLGDIIGAFKSLTTHEYILNVKNNGWKPFDIRLWQRNYYEHIIRSKTDLDKIREYIRTNPQMWDRDRNNPKFKRAATQVKTLYNDGVVRFGPATGSP